MRMWLLVGLVLLAHNVAWPKDFGVEGHSFPIMEEDMMKMIEARLSMVDREKLNRLMQEKTTRYVQQPPEVVGIRKATVSRTFTYDPSYTVHEDILDHEYQVLHAAGTKVNPLAHVPMRQSLCFIDGTDAAQVQQALELRKQHQNKLKIILVRGSPLALQRKHKVWIYFDQAGSITKKLGIQEVPALVKQEGLQLRVDILGEEPDA